MDGTPHTHAPELKKDWIRGDTRYHWYLKYGDTSIKIRSADKAPTPREVEKALAQAVKKHDEGSIAAQTEADAVNAAYVHLNELVAKANSVGATGWLSSRLGFLKKK